MVPWQTADLPALVQALNYNNKIMTREKIKDNIVHIYDRQQTSIKWQALFAALNEINNMDSIPDP